MFMHNNLGSLDCCACTLNERFKHYSCFDLYMYLKVEMFPPAVEVRAILEGQFLARRMYTEMSGLLGETKISLVYHTNTQVKIVSKCHKHRSYLTHFSAGWHSI